MRYWLTSMGKGFLKATRISCLAARLRWIKPGLGNYNIHRTGPQTPIDQFLSQRSHYIIFPKQKPNLGHQSWDVPMIGCCLSSFVVSWAFGANTWWLKNQSMDSWFTHVSPKGLVWNQYSTVHCWYDCFVDNSFLTTPPLFPSSPKQKKDLIRDVNNWFPTFPFSIMILVWGVSLFHPY